jgi:sulfotransferase
MKQLNMCTGLPRSGSTVLMNILQQNNKLFTTASCALPDLLHQHTLIKSRFREHFQAMDPEQADSAMYGLIHGAAQGWFSGLTEKPVVISKSRSWSNLIHLFNHSKVIVTVRDLRDIVESFQKVEAKTKALHSFGDNNMLLGCMTDHEKYKYYFDTMNSLSGPLQTEVPRMMELFKKDRSRVLFVRYEDFTKEPERIIGQIYNHLEMEPFKHDLCNIQQSKMYEHDHAYFRERTSHVTQKEFRFYEEPKRTMPQWFQDKILKEYRWFYEGFYPSEL